MGISVIIDGNNIWVKVRYEIGGIEYYDHYHYEHTEEVDPYYTKICPERVITNGTRLEPGNHQIKEILVTVQETPGVMTDKFGSTFILTRALTQPGIPEKTEEQEREYQSRRKKKR
ncbi:hypothetical protein SPB21_19170 [Leptothoe sp. ISB3NOV94-8A]